MLAAIAAAAAQDATPTTHDQIVAWQKRLVDVGCDGGGFDDVAGTAFDAAAKTCPNMKP
jgi:hypothetical protein